MTPFEKELQQVTDLISLPEIYLKIQSLMDDPTSDIEDFSRVIGVDPNLSAKILQLVNSAYFGFAGSIESISRAVKLIGIGQLHMMVLGISAVSSLDYPNDIVPLKSLWRSSLFCGCLSRELGLHLNLRGGERLFIIGLLHEIGHLVLYAKFPEQAKQVLQHAAEQALRIEQAEQELLGCHYGEIGAKLMAQWKLSEDFQNLIRCQPNPGQAEDNQVETAILHIAHAYAQKQLIEPELPLHETIDNAAWAITGLSPDIVQQNLDAALSKSADMEKVIIR